MARMNKSYTGGKVNYEGNLGGAKMPRSKRTIDQRNTTGVQGTILSKATGGAPRGARAPEFSKVKALDGAAPRRAGRGGRGPTLPPVA